MRRQRERKPDNARPDLTPMIDVTFQLLIFFILCTRFATPEAEHRLDLPDNEGLTTDPGLPKEQVTIYCAWDEGAQANSYMLAVDGRGRLPVDGSYARLNDLVIYPSDSAETVAGKKRLYRLQFEGLLRAIESCIRRTGANVEKLEIAFHIDTTRSAVQLTPPWLFVSLALDACVQLNVQRDVAGEPQLPVTFKFADAPGQHR